MAAGLHRAQTGSPSVYNAAKVGLGLWDHPAVAFGLEALLLLGGTVLCTQAGLLRRTGGVVFGIVILGVQAYVFFGPPPSSPAAIAVTALAAYAVFAGIVHVLERKPAFDEKLL